MYSMTLLNSAGDVTIGWDDSSKSTVIAFIEAKLKEGHTFFIPINNQDVRVKDISQLDTVSSVLIADKDFKEMADNTLLRHVLVERTESIPHRSSRKAEEIASSSSMVTKPMRGG